MLIILLVFALFILFVKFRKSGITYMEGYHDITPYDYHWDIFKCYTSQCVRDKSKICYDWCNKWGEPGAQENCRQRCLDYGDIQTESLRFNNYTFGRDANMDNFRKHTPLRDSPYVLSYNAIN